VSGPIERESIKSLIYRATPKIRESLEPQELWCGLSGGTTERTTLFRCERSFKGAVRNPMRSLIAFSDSLYFVRSSDVNRGRIVLSIHAEDDF
jgi:hypothetical protein